MKKRRARDPVKEVSALAWIQDAYGNVLLVKQRQRPRLSGRCRAARSAQHEPIKAALRRELREEIGLTVVSARVLDLFDRPVKGALAILFRTVLRRGKLKLGDAEIQEAAFVNRLPPKATPKRSLFLGAPLHAQRARAEMRWSLSRKSGVPAFCTHQRARYYLLKRFRPLLR